MAYSVAVALPVVVTLLCMLTPHPRRLIWPALATLYVAVVVILAVWVGWAQAIVALVEGALLLDYYFIGPPHSLSIPNTSDLVIFASFVIMGFLIAGAIGWRRANERRLQVALALMQAQDALTQTRAASDISDLAAEASNSFERERRMSSAQESAARRLETLADRIGSAAGIDASMVREMAADLRAEAGRLRNPSESPN